MTGRMKGLAGVVAVALAVVACDHPVSQQDHDSVVANHDALIVKLTEWSDSVFQWQSRTYQTICEIAVAADPNGDGDFSDIGSATQLYCGPGAGGGSPSSPPDWGG